MFIIGVDPHRGSHVAVVLDDREHIHDELAVTANRLQRQRLLDWAADYQPRVWAIEGAAGTGALLAQQLVAAGEQVIDVPPALAARVRLLDNEQRSKMLATGDLHRITRLADQQLWRLALVGDPHQLQAVGRGGMFAELCATGRTIELESIHRFRNQWEAAASLKLRHGDPAGLDAYLDHDRIWAAPLAEHLDNIALDWVGHHPRGQYTAITTTTNEHVDAINHHIQHHRLEIGDLGDAAVHFSDVSFHVGDVITTRRNERSLLTSTGDSVRNRDYWTIDAIAADGALTVTRIDGHGTITLPAEYAGEHVQLGYAATEPGNQSDTATRSLTLATPATTCRGLYVAATRGQDENLILVVTDSHDLRDAIDTLEQILASDRADTPATTVRRELAAAIPPAPPLQPRCAIPDWFDDVHCDADRELAQARARVDAEQREHAQIQQRITELTRQLRDLAPRCAPHDHVIAGVGKDLQQARQRHRQAERDLADCGYFGRRAARLEVAEAAEQDTTADTALAEVTRRAQPVLDERNQLRSELDRLHQHTRVDRPLLRALGRNDDRLESAEQTIEALDVWKAWATGRTVDPSALVESAIHLHRNDGDQAALARPLLNWLERHRIVQPQHSIERPTPHIEPPGLGIDL